MQTTLANLILELLPLSGIPVPLPDGVHLFRSDSPFARTPVSYQSEVIFLAQGSKRVYFGNDIVRYDPSRYLVVPMPLPTECSSEVEPGKPLLGMSVALDKAELEEIASEIDESETFTSSIPKALFGAAMTDDILAACVGMLRSMKNARDAKVLAPMRKKEILYRVLTGENGWVIRGLLGQERGYFRIARTLRVIHESFGENLSVAELARMANMSESTFHSAFKSVTESSPLQYIKGLRLHKAREYITQSGMNASQAAYSVGYESPSQFSREYKRLFGTSPVRGT